MIEELVMHQMSRQEMSDHDPNAYDLKYHHIEVFASLIQDNIKSLRYITINHFDNQVKIIIS